MVNWFKSDEHIKLLEETNSQKKKIQNLSYDEIEFGEEEVARYHGVEFYLNDSFKIRKCEGELIITNYKLVVKPVKFHTNPEGKRV